MANKRSVMPRILRIGPYRYSLRIDDAAIVIYMRDNVTPITAFTDLDKREMLFTRDANPHSVLHEVLHAIADLSGLDIRLGTDRTEDVIQSLDHLLLDVLRDNAALIRFLTEA